MVSGQRESKCKKIEIIKQIVKDFHRNNKLIEIVKVMIRLAPELRFAE